MRPVLNEARLGIMRDDLQLVKTKNGLLARSGIMAPGRPPVKLVKNNRRCSDVYNF